MKKIIILVIFTISSIVLKAQIDGDTTHFAAGFLFAPQAGISLKSPEKGFTGYYPLHANISFSKKKFGGLIFYSLPSSSLGAGLVYNFNYDYGIYSVVTKSTMESGGYNGLGFTRTVANGNAILFVELGRSWANEPLSYIGLIIPYKFKIR